jgi:hypothetical protein
MLPPTIFAAAGKLRTLPSKIVANPTILKRNDLPHGRTAHVANNCHSWAQYFRIWCVSAAQGLKQFPQSVGAAIGHSQRITG